MSRPPSLASSVPRGSGRWLTWIALGLTLLGGALACYLSMHAGPRLSSVAMNEEWGEEVDSAQKLADHSQHRPVFILLEDEACWAHLPALTRGKKGPLPLWARTLARTLPQTTAAMLELDYLHRSGSALPPRLRGEVRWVAARANRCAYGEATALGDLRAAGVGDADLRILTGDPTGWTADNRAVLVFASKLTESAHSVTDHEVAQLIERYGEKTVVAVVLLLAYANFQDRLLLALNIGPETAGPLPPLDVKFARRRLGAVALVPPRKVPPGQALATAPEITGPDCPPLDLAGIRADLAKQRCRLPRILLPKADGAANRWGLVGQTYQPELATAWSACTQAFGEESDQDPVFEQCLFWVVTRTKQCFY